MAIAFPYRSRRNYPRNTWSSIAATKKELTTKYAKHTKKKKREPQISTPEAWQALILPCKAGYTDKNEILLRKQQTDR